MLGKFAVSFLPLSLSDIYSKKVSDSDDLASCVKTDHITPS